MPTSKPWSQSAWKTMDVSLMDQSDGRPHGIQEEQPSACTRGANGAAVSSQTLLWRVPCNGPVMATRCPETNTGLLAVVFTF